MFVDKTGQDIEFCKEVFVNDNLNATICGLLNGQGGKILFGINEN